MTKGMDWRGFENLVKTEARFFSRTAANQLTSIFDGMDELRTRDGRRVVVDAGPGTGLDSLYRARVFQSDDKLRAALGRPDIHLGSPPASLAAAGRMNARGISVFYGANNQKVAIAEVRPPVGTQIAVAQFEIIRKLRLLDLEILSDVRVTESLADCGPNGRIEGAMFLRSLTGRITRPVMLDDEPFEYLATQAIVDFLATQASVQVDGIIFPSLQAVGDAFNLVLFHKAARVELMNVPEGTEFSASTGRWAEDGWVDDYQVTEKVPPFGGQVNTNEQDRRWSDCPAIAGAIPGGSRDTDWRDASLRVLPESVEVHRVKRVDFATDEFMAKRHRRLKTGLHRWRVGSAAVGLGCRS